MKAIMVDNGLNVCSIEIANTWGPRDPFNCTKIFKACIDPVGRELYYQNGNNGLFHTDVRYWEDVWREKMTFLKGKWYGCEMPNWKGRVQGVDYTGPETPISRVKMGMMLGRERLEDVEIGGVASIRTSQVLASLEELKIG